MAFSNAHLLLLLLSAFWAIKANPVSPETTLPDTNTSVPITERDGLSKRAELIGFYGCSTIEKSMIKQAFKDAVMIVRAMGEPRSIDFDSVMAINYFGEENKKHRQTIIANFERAQDAGPNINTRDEPRWEMHCDDTGDQYGGSCGKKDSEARAYLVDFRDKKLKNAQAIFNFCPDFFKDDSMSDKIDGIRDYPNLYPKDDVRSMTSQGNIFLHEMFHIEYRFGYRYSDERGGSRGGISHPRCMDRALGTLPGKAYGPRRTKFLARSTLGGSEVAYQNNDNYVFFALEQFMWRKYGVLPKNPKHGWPLGGTKRAEKSKVLSDIELYGSNEPIQCVGMPAAKPSTTQDYALKKIAKFCQGAASLKKPLIDPVFTYYPAGYRARTNPTCGGKDLTVKQKDCERLLGQTVKQCSKDTTQKKYGGAIFGECGVYEMILKSGNDETPPMGAIEALMKKLVIKPEYEKGPEEEKALMEFEGGWG